MAQPASSAAATAATTTAPGIRLDAEPSPFTVLVDRTGRYVGSVRVEPSVVLGVLEIFLRRNAGSERVVGTLLGQQSGRVVEVTSCYAVPSVEREGVGEVALAKDYNRQMRALMARSNPGEVVVGWFAASNGLPLDTKSCLVHEFYTTECANPVHLKFDLSQGAHAVAAFRSVSLSLSPAVAWAAEFRQVPLELAPSPAARIALDSMIKLAGRTAQLPATKEGVQHSVARLLALLEQVGAYVDDVVDGRVAPNPAVGKMLSDLLESVPTIQPDVFSGALSNTLNDLVMVSYLANLTRAQLVLAEKLGSVI